ncbi:hypothetical protein ACFLQ6_04870 [Thermoproteota archaeon]
MSLLIIWGMVLFFPLLAVAIWQLVKGLEEVVTGFSQGEIDKKSYQKIGLSILIFLFLSWFVLWCLSGIGPLG